MVGQFLENVGSFARKLAAATMINTVGRCPRLKVKSLHRVICRSSRPLRSYKHHFLFNADQLPAALQRFLKKDDSLQFH